MHKTYHGGRLGYVIVNLFEILCVKSSVNTFSSAKSGTSFLYLDQCSIKSKGRGNLLVQNGTKWGKMKVFSESLDLRTKTSIPKISPSIMENFEQFLDNFWLHEQNYEYNVINVDNFLIPLTLPPPPHVKLWTIFGCLSTKKSSTFSKIPRSPSLPLFLLLLPPKQRIVLRIRHWTSVVPSNNQNFKASQKLTILTKWKEIRKLKALGKKNRKLKAKWNFFGFY